MLTVDGVSGYLILGDIHYLANKIRSLPSSGVVVEIGGFMGLSTVTMARQLQCENNHDAQIYCIDTWGGSPEHQHVAEVREGTLHEAFLKNMKKTGVASMVTPIKSPSVDAAKHFSPGSVDFLFVDGLHTFEGCYSDLEAWYPKVKPSGTMIGHDCVPGGGVERAMKRFTQKRGLTSTVTPPPHAHYMYEIGLGGN